MFETPKPQQNRVRFKAVWRISTHSFSHTKHSWTHFNQTYTQFTLSIVMMLKISHHIGVECFPVRHTMRQYTQTDLELEMSLTEFCVWMIAMNSVFFHRSIRRAFMNKIVEIDKCRRQSRLDLHLTVRNQWAFWNESERFILCKIDKEHFCVVRCWVQCVN